MNEPHLLAALARLRARDPGYRPRTHHLDPGGAPRFTNRLILEGSPYLLQHAHNPVDWRPWGDGAFAEARRRDVPVFLSVGYATCHWCHVMERESFEDLEVSAALNEGFVPVKVDREERPDVDAVFMAFVQATAGRGGWPMTVFLSPDRVPLLGGTYFPARDGDRGGAPGLLTVLGAVSARWREPALLSQGRRVWGALQPPSASSVLPSEEALQRARDQLIAAADPRWGGFGGAPKFPRPTALLFLLDAAARGDAEALRVVETTLDRMRLGGLYDHVGGGFARYSTDAQWLVPHFEKMLYDQAQLVDAYVEAWRLTGAPRHAAVARDVIAYLGREMTAPSGALYAATDADSPGPDGEPEEGRFFVWTPAEVEDALAAGEPGDAAWVGRTFDVTRWGNFEGRSILHLDAPLDPADEARWARARQLLYDARARRPAPALDDKLVASWNGLAVAALARAGWALGDDAIVRQAARAGGAVWAALVRQEPGPAGDEVTRVSRSFSGGQARHAGVLEDYAALLVAALELLQATLDPAWLARAVALGEALLARFAAPDGAGFLHGDAAGEALPLRDRPTYDGAEPSGNALAAQGLLRLEALTGDGRWRAPAEGAIRAAGDLLRRAPSAAPAALRALRWAREGVRLVVIVTSDGVSGMGGGEGAVVPGGEDARALIDVVRRQHAPDVVLLVGPAGGPLAEAAPAAFLGRTALDGHPTAYVCRGTVCSAPVTEPQDLAAVLATRPAS